MLMRLRESLWTACPHCFNTLKKEELTQDLRPAKYEVVHSYAIPEAIIGRRGGLVWKAGQVLKARKN